ncbi:divergent protein kinase domain 2A [Zerene cesonia]|uniref:divergent protein kinase domain 2A n=1 Tax=Zerene cesonia TaxID=33412 RepID=UPI0018E58123|nr:divergent protein kinase domain 2A [Zerene cesonia]
MREFIYKKMLLRRRFCKRIIVIAIVFIASFYGSVLLFGNLKGPQIIQLTNLDRCPACYGVTVCPELYSNQIILDSTHWSSMFNVRNIFYGYTKSNRRVVLKKLGHDWEFREFDEKICKIMNLSESCNVKALLNISNIDQKVIDIVQYNLSWPDTEPRKGIVLCPYAYSIYDLLHPLLNNRNGNYKSEMINIWTMLNINPEPILLQVIPKTKGWPVPAYGGVCGRLEVVAYEGESLSSLANIPWLKKLKYAQKILSASMDFTFKHDKFRFYLMDWSLDNIVANEKDEISFVDLEDVVILDKNISPKKDLPDWYQRYNREALGPGFTFSIENMCRHHLSDHNIWAACYVLAGDDNPFLYPIPKEINSTRPHFDRLLHSCLHGDDKFRTAGKLQHVIEDMLLDEKIIALGTIR